MSTSAITQAAEQFGAKHGVGENSDRLAGHVDSWIALAIVVMSLLVALLLNRERHGVRQAGVLLAGLSCIGVAVWFAIVLATGALANTKPPVIPIDKAKPALLWLQAGAAALAGAYLLLVGLRMRDGRGARAAPLHNEPARYGQLSRWLHWTTAILFLSLIPMGVFMSLIPETVWFRQGYYVVHKTVGLIVLGLLLVRVVWNLMSPRPALDPSLKRWERWLAHGVHRGLYLLLIAFPITGFVMSTYGGKLSHFFIWDTPLWWGKDMQAVIPWALLHKLVLPYLAYLIIGAHVLGALKHHYLDRQREAIRRMVG